ncbi:MAG TPA: hypothetical protein VJ840_09210 [Gemmatimonadaceae bacterium]|nr:hypothetical protein [Gemmatimonadaceae bacterium]
MKNPSPFGATLRAYLRQLLIVVAMFILPSAVMAQEHEHDDDHDHLHFSHPLVTESPSPDTKIRLDYAVVWTSEAPKIRDYLLRVEGEYAFTHSVSLALTAPYEFRTEPATDRANGFGNLELSLKFASLRYGEHGALIGGGFAAEFPTGSDEKEIGSSHLFELEPFLDAGYKREKLELVGFARLSSTVNRRPGEESERSLAFDFSSLYRLHPRLEALLELTTERALVGSEAGIPQTFFAPGLKIYPFANPQLMFGASLQLGTGALSSVKGAVVSAFYHF